MARPREKIDVIAAKGRKHLTKAEYEERKNTEIDAPADDIRAPDFLSKKERGQFDYLACQLSKAQIMTNLDCYSLGMYVRAATQYERASKKLNSIERSTEPLEEKTGLYNRWSIIEARYFKECTQLAAKLGLEPVSRCRLAIPKEEEEKPANKFLVFKNPAI